MIEQTKLKTVCTRIKTVLPTAQPDQIINTTNSAGYSTIITRSVLVHLSDQYDNWL